MIHLHDNIYLDADERNWIVGKKITIKRKDKEGNEVATEEVRGDYFYGTIGNMLDNTIEHAVRNKVSNGHLKSLVSILNEFKKMQNKFEKMLDDDERVFKRLR